MGCPRPHTRLCIPNQDLFRLLSRFFNFCWGFTDLQKCQVDYNRDPLYRSDPSTSNWHLSEWSLKCRVKAVRWEMLLCGPRQPEPDFFPTTRCERSPHGKDMREKYSIPGIACGVTGFIKFQRIHSPQPFPFNLNWYSGPYVGTGTYCCASSTLKRFYWKS